MKIPLKMSRSFLKCFQRPARAFFPLIPLLKMDKQRPIILKKFEPTSNHRDRRFAISDFTVLCGLSSTTKKEIDFGGSCCD
jgi:hypothetical protein